MSDARVSVTTGGRAGKGQGGVESGSGNRVSEATRQEPREKPGKGVQVGRAGGESWKGQMAKRTPPRPMTRTARGRSTVTHSLEHRCQRREGCCLRPGRPTGVTLHTLVLRGVRQGGSVWKARGQVERGWGTRMGGEEEGVGNRKCGSRSNRRHLCQGCETGSSGECLGCSELL